jgi:hypothetical protein
VVSDSDDLIVHLFQRLFESFQRVFDNRQDPFIVCTLRVLSIRLHSIERPTKIVERNLIECVSLRQPTWRIGAEDRIERYTT